jgi:hypothetical protein
MATRTITARSRTASSIAKEVSEQVRAGRDAVVVLGKSPDPERVMSIIGAVVGDTEVQLVVRHAEMQEYVQNALTGAALGSAVAVGGYALTKLSSGGALSLEEMVVSIVIGGLAGASLGIGLATVAEVRVYRYNGESKIKFLPHGS